MILIISGMTYGPLTGKGRFVTYHERPHCKGRIIEKFLKNNVQNARN